MKISPQMLEQYRVKEVETIAQAALRARTLSDGKLLHYLAVRGSSS